MTEEDELSLQESLTSLESSAKRSDKVIRKATVSAARRLIQQDSKWVLRSKICLISLILVAAASTSIGVYRFTVKSEDEDFVVRFTDFANEIIEVSQINAVSIFHIYETMSMTMTNHARGRHGVWPLVQFNNYEAMAYEAIKNTRAKFVGYTPIVKNEDRQAYENFTYQNQEWIKEGLNYMGIDNSNASLPVDYIHCNDIEVDQMSMSRPEVLDYMVCPEANEYAPIAQISPIASMYASLNDNAFSFDYFTRTYEGMIKAREAVLSEVVNLSEEDTLESEWPVSFMAAPIYEKQEHLQEPENLVGVIIAELPWHSYFLHLIPEGIDGIHLVVRNTCDQVFTYVINGPEVDYLGPGDLHHPSYDGLEVKTDFTTFTSIPECKYEFRLYPTPAFEAAYQSSTPITNTITVLIIFLVTALVFILYDILVQRRQNKLLLSAERTGELVNSLFPENVRERLIGDSVKEVSNKKDSFGAFLRENHSQETQTAMIQRTQPIADLFPHVTILFGDLVGFTAWSSVREPTQVFTLLETLYGAFDKIARKLGVFKVETIGDCYLAAAGLPEPRDDHAVLMARFARHCMVKLNEIVHELEYTLGPGTSDLAMRIGLHSGPVTAGVLRGEKSRFQLFGDTVNTAARMESTGMKSKIQISQQTADLIIEAGKAGWVKAREDMVVAKGKGELQTFWLTYRSSSITDSNESNNDRTESMSQSLSSSEHQGGEEVHASTAATGHDKSMEILVAWNVDFLESLLKKIVAMRGADFKPDIDAIEKLGLYKDGKNFAISEVKEHVHMIDNPSAFVIDPEGIELDQQVVLETHDFVNTIATLYPPLPYHSFAHATHVAQSVAKLLSRVVVPDAIDCESMSDVPRRCRLSLHHAMYGVAPDPLTLFACAFAAIIHGVDQLRDDSNDPSGQEDANRYQYPAIAQQNAIEVVWGLLMEPRYKHLRGTIFTTQRELQRFHYLVVRAVHATDVYDVERIKSQTCNWNEIFHCEVNPEGSVDDPKSSMITSDHKAVAVVEILLAASSLSHAMQHWSIFIKWNELLFVETYEAYLSGRGTKDPSETWYQDHLQLFDSNIIPLARTTKMCRVFGCASDEYINYSLNNRKEWEIKGMDMVAFYKSNYYFAGN